MLFVLELHQAVLCKVFDCCVFTSLFQIIALKVAVNIRVLLILPFLVSIFLLPLAFSRAILKCQNSFLRLVVDIDKFKGFQSIASVVAGTVYVSKNLNRHITQNLHLLLKILIATNTAQLPS